MKKTFILLWLMVCITSGCSFNVEVVTPAAPQANSATVPPTVDVPVATIPVTPVPSVGFTPATTDPIFYGGSATSDQGVASGQSSFPPGTKEIFVIWNYQNMREGLSVKREWYLDGQVWLTREEPWDFTKYGASGIMRDVSIHDFETGLESGAYQLRIYINNALQPIGSSSATLNFLNFIVQPNEAFSGLTSPDLQWVAEIHGEKRIVIRDLNGAPRDLYTGREVPYLTWFADSRNILFVDRDRSKQQPGSPLGARDDLWIADIQTGEKHLLYKSETAFGGHAGPLLSTYERYIVSLEGSGYGDACGVDSRLIFLELSNDHQSVVKAIKQEQFTGLPTSSDGIVYPMDDGTWEADNLFRVTLDGTCSTDRNQLGSYLFNIAALTATKGSSVSVPPSAGDLGWGKIHGKITDAVTGAPIAGATVMCSHNSYTSPARCSGSTTTNADGMFIFDNVFFHDTDTIKLIVQAAGYQPKEISRASFTLPDMEADIYLNFPL